MSTSIMSSPMQCIFSHGMAISFLFENMLANLLSPGTIIDVIDPVFKSAHTSCTYPSLFPLLILTTSLCLKSSPFPVLELLYDSFLGRLPKC